MLAEEREATDEGDALFNLLGDEPAQIALYAADAAALLNGEGHLVCMCGLMLLGKLEASKLAEHADAVAACISNNEDGDGSLLHTALATLGKLAPADLATHADAVAACISNNEDGDGALLETALATLGKLAPADLSKHVECVVDCLNGHEHLGVRRQALHTLHKMEPSAVSTEFEMIYAVIITVQAF